MGKRKWKYPTGNKDYTGKWENSRLYGVWRSMICRCYRKTHVEYNSYGGIGISVCEEWLSYDNFYEWAMETGYDDTAHRGACTLDRVDVTGNYNPSNCRWVDMKTQQRNKRNTVLIEGKTLAEISEITGLNLGMLTKRYYTHGFSTIAELAQTSDEMRKTGREEMRKTRTKIFVEGVSLVDIANSYNIPYITVFARYKRGKRTLKELSKPLRGA